MILIPVKNLSGAKQRLSPLLTSEQRTSLARAMAEDVFDALLPFASDPGVTVVSGDAWASQQAKSRKFSIIVDDAEAGETAAIELATKFAVGSGAEFTVVFPADIPLIQSSEVGELLSLKPVAGCVISPAADQRGTNGILRIPGDLIPLRFGNDSFLPHLAAARAAGHEVIVQEFVGIGLDIDRPENVFALMKQPVQSRAQRLLLEWNILSNTHA